MLSASIQLLIEGVLSKVPTHGGQVDDAFRFAAGIQYQDGSGANQVDIVVIGI